MDIECFNAPEDTSEASSASTQASGFTGGNDTSISTCVGIETPDAASISSMLDHDESLVYDIISCVKINHKEHINELATA